MALTCGNIQTIMGIATGIKSTQTTEYANLIYWIQHALDDIYAREWTFNRVKGQFTASAPYETGTITATAGSTTVTGSGTTFVTTWVDAYIPLNNTQHHIATADTTTQLTLTAAPDASVTAGSSYAIYFPVVELDANIARLERVQSYPYEPCRIVNEQEAGDLFLQDDTRDYASHVALLSPGATTKYSRVALYPFPTERQVYTYHGYRQAPTLITTTETGIPDAMRELLVEMSLARHWTYQDKSPRRADRCERRAAMLTERFMERDSKAKGPREIRGWSMKTKTVPSIYSTYDTWG